MKLGDTWERFQPGEPVELRALSPLHRDAYSVHVIGRGPDRLRLTYPMDHGRLVLLPVGCSVSLRARSARGPEVWTKVVERIPGPNRCVVLARPAMDAPLVSMRPRETRGTVIAVVGSKGGVGTSVLAANLAAALSGDGAPVCLVDAAPGSGHADVLLNVFPRWTLREVLEGERSAFEAATQGPGSLMVLGGGRNPRGRTDPGVGTRTMMRALQQIASHVDAVVIDAGSRLDPYAAEVLAAADERIVVTTTDPHGVVETYALLHSASEQPPVKPWGLVVNMAPNVLEGKKVAEKAAFAATQFLGTPLFLAGVLVRDRAMERAVRRRQLVVHEAPRSSAARTIRALAAEVRRSEGTASMAEPRARGLWRRLLGRSVSPRCV